MSVIKVMNGCKEYRSKFDSNKVLQNIMLNVTPGTIYSIMGPSGCGKTTLISSLVGISCLDSGDIEIFGEPPGINRLRIGYMPQENGLIPEFTISEMLWFFGTIFGMSGKQIGDRFRFLTELLELPDGNSLVKNCSGGQQRRVSFALTLVHEPDILILDEPTVGLDPLLRVKIWDYLLDITRNKNATVLLSTHYIEEARQSNRIGLLRNGFLIAEDSPQNVLLKSEAVNLEEAFLKLSEMQERDFLNQNSSKTCLPSIEMSQSDDTIFAYQPSKHKTVFAEQTVFGILLALTVKNFIQILRNIDVLFVAVFVPLIGCLCLHFAIGGRIKDLTLGIVNSEVRSHADCLNSSLITVEIKDFECRFDKLSCRFISALNNDVNKHFYSQMSDALEDTRRGKIVGFINFESNFTQSLPHLNYEASKDVSDNGLIQVHLDHTDMQKAFYMKNMLYDSFENFSEHLMTECQLAVKAGNRPIVFFSSFGKLNFDFRTTMLPGMILTVFFTVASYLLTISITCDRLEGTWNRSLVAGAKAKHFVMSHFIEGTLVMLLQFVVYASYTIFFLGVSLSQRGVLLLALLLFLTGLAGLCYGLMCSIFMKSTISATFAAQTFVYPVLFVSGVLWPIEALPDSLHYLGLILPYAYPVAAFRNILVKDSGFWDRPIYYAVIVLSLWVVVQLATCFWLVRDKNDPKLKKTK